MIRVALDSGAKFRRIQNLPSELVLAFGGPVTNDGGVESSKHRDVFNETARRAAPDDFWGQVQRTVNGRVVDEAQIEMIVDAICRGLEVRSDDVVLDLCCGNGALSDRIFALVQGGVGVDFAEELIAVARKFFERLPSRRYVFADVTAFVKHDCERSVFTKAICYGSFQLLAPDRALELLVSMRVRYPALQRVFIGNHPDRDRAVEFFADREYIPGEEFDHERPLGMWRTAKEMTELAEAAGWIATIHRMPDAFYAAHYRFDAILNARTSKE